MAHRYARAGGRSGLPALAALLATFLTALALLTDPQPATARKLPVRKLPAAWETLRSGSQGVGGADKGTVPISRAASWREMRTRLPKSALHSHLQLGKQGPSVIQRRLAKDRAKGLRGGGTGSPDTLVVRIALLRVDFNTDRKGSQTTGDGHFQQVFSDSSIFIDPPPHDDRYFRAQLEAVNRYWSSMTWGHVRLEGDVFPRNQRFGAYHLTDMADYGPTSPDEFFSIDGLTRYSRESLMAADQDADLDWKNYDVIFVCHAGADWQNDVLQDTPFDLPSFSITFSDSDVVVTDTADTLTTMMTFPETSTQDGFQVALNGVVAHEMGHQLGLLDIYNVETFAPTVGLYDVMDSGNQTIVSVPRPSPTSPDSTADIIGALPSAIGAWNRWQVTFPFGVDPVTIKEDTPRAHLRAVQARGSGAPQWYRLPVSDTEYYLLENRVDDLDGKTPDGAYNTALDQDDSTGVILGPIVGDSDPPVISHNYDLLLDGPGMLIWHIDERQALAFLSVGRGLNVDFDHRSVRIEEADGLVDIGSPFSPFPLGTPNEAFWAPNNSNFTPSSRPSSITDVGSPSGISIMNIGPRGQDIPMDIGFSWKPRGWPMTIGGYGTSGLTSTTAADVDGDGVDEVAALGASNAFLFRYDDKDGDGEVDSPAGWPANGVALRGTPVFTQALGDFVGDGNREMACVTDSGFVYAIRADGAPFGTVDSSGALLTFGVAAAPTWPAIPADLSGDGKDELYVVGHDARLRGYDLSASGAPVSRFPARFLLDAVADSGATLVSTLAFGDLNGDGALDGLVSYVHRDSLYIQRFDGLGRRILRLSYPLPPQAHAIADERVWMGLADLDRKAGANDLEIVLALASGWVVVLDKDGNILPGWPVVLDSAIGGPPAFGDLDGDGLLEIVLSGVREVHALNYNGTEMPGWPSRPRLLDFPGPFMTSGPAAIADVDGDGRPDVVCGFTDWTLRAIAPDGKPIQDFTMPMGNTPMTSPVILDANGDGRLDLFVQAGDGHVYAKILGSVASAQNPAWPMFGGDARLHGAYDASRMPTVRGGTGPILASRVMIFPNPVHGNAPFSVRYTLGTDLDQSTQVDLALYNVAGEKVRAAHGTTFANTENIITLSSDDLASGVYFCTLHVRSGAREQSSKDRIAVIK